MSSFGNFPVPLPPVGVQGQTGEQVRLGTPTDGDLADGIAPLDPNDTVVDAIDAVNEAAKTVTDGLQAQVTTVDGKDGGDIEVGIPTDGSYGDGQVPILPTDKIADAVDALNEGLKGAYDAIDGFLDRVGWTRVSDVTVPGGTATGKTYLDPPNNTVLESVTVSNGSFEVIVEAAYPTIEVNGDAHIIPLVGSIYRGSVPVTLLADGDVVVQVFDADGTPGAVDTITVTIDAPPVISSATFTGSYPGSQTELKQGDTFQLQVTADKDFDTVVVEDFGAAEADSIAVVVGMSATVTITVADRGTTPQQLAARVSVLDATTAAASATYDTDTTGSVDGVNVLTLNNLFPTVSFGSPTYPGGQQALKGAEQATVPVTLSDLDTVLFDDNGTGELVVTDPSVIEATKTVTRNGGTYNVSSNNLRATANRAANDATTVQSSLVQIANVAVTITVGAPAARLRSGGNDGTAAQNHVITISGDQQLLSAPFMDPGAGSAGVFIGGGWVGGGATWTRSLQVNDNDDKGVKSWTNLSATNLAGILTTVISVGSTYTLGGFVPRTIVVPAFASTVQFNVEVVDFSKVQAGNFSPGGPSVKQPIGTVADTINGYTIDAVAINPTTLELLDLAAIAANSLGLYNLIDLEEVV